MNYYFKPSVSFQGNYETILKEMLQVGTIRETRGFKTIEFSPFVYITDNPLQNILTNNVRNINHAFSIAEFLWILSGRNDVEMISTYNKNIINYSDNKIIFYGAYGPHITNQIEYIINCFKEDICTRRAVITIWKQNPDLKSVDIPCTLSLQFLINKNKLDLIVNMRSNDIWLGLPYDLFNFTMFQNYIAMKLKIEIGKYTHIAGTEHMYSRDFEKAKLASLYITHVSDLKTSLRFETDELTNVLMLENKMRNYFKSKNLDKFNVNDFNILTIPWKSLILVLFEYLKNKK